MSKFIVGKNTILPLLTEAEVLDRIKDKPYILLSKYLGARHFVRVRCKKDGFEWVVRGDKIFEAQYPCNCPICAKIKRQQERVLKRNQFEHLTSRLTLVDISTPAHPDIQVLMDRKYFLNLVEDVKISVMNVSTIRFNTVVTARIGAKTYRVAKLVRPDCTTIGLKNGNPFDLRRTNIVSTKKILWHYVTRRVRGRNKRVLEKVPLEKPTTLSMRSTVAEGVKHGQWVAKVVSDEGETLLDQIYNEKFEAKADAWRVELSYIVRKIRAGK